MFAIGYTLTILMGMTLALIGAGGSILTMPILVYFLKVSPVTATGYSLLLVGVTATLASIRYYRKGQIDLKTAVWFGVPSMVAVYVTRRYILPSLPNPIFDHSFMIIGKDTFIMMLFALLMLLASFFMIREQKSLPFKQFDRAWFRLALITLEGIVVGIFTGMVGAGGGFLIMPTLILLSGLPVKVAVGTSLSIIAIKSLVGFIGDIETGIAIDYHLLIWLLGYTLLGMIIGTMLSKHLSANMLKKGFGWFTLTIAALMMMKEM